MQRTPSHRQPRRFRGFTIIELLTVLAIIGILAAILVPTVTASQNSAKRAKTRVQFSQWATAIEGFRQEYGYYPNFGPTAPDFDFEDGKIDGSAYLDTKLFVETLSGRPINSDPMGANGNTKRITFCTFGTGDLTANTTHPLLQDAFGNREFVVLMDRNQDGLIRVRTTTNDDYTDGDAAPPVLSASGQTVASPVSVPIRAGVAIYSAGDGTQAVKSWE